MLGFVGVGSNLGDRLAALRAAVHSLAECGCQVKKQSAVYETDPVDLPDQPLFLNCVVEIETALAPLELLRRIHEIEAACGRVRTVTKGPRTLDIDILLYGDLVMRSTELTIPHPRMMERRFVLEPLAELAPDMVISGIGMTVAAALALLPASPAVRRLPELP